MCVGKERVGNGQTKKEKNKEGIRGTEKKKKRKRKVRKITKEKKGNCI